MKFNRGIKYKQKEATTRRISRAKRSLKQKREKLPLLAPLIPELNITPEDRIATQEDQWKERLTHSRAFTAKQWKKAREIIFSQPQEKRKELIRAWNTSPYPKDPAYLLAWLRSTAFYAGDPQPGDPTKIQRNPKQQAHPYE